MSTTLHELYCTHCNDFRIFHPTDYAYICTHCESPYAPMNSPIPDDVVYRQIHRFVTWRNKMYHLGRYKRFNDHIEHPIYDFESSIYSPTITTLIEKTLRIELTVGNYKRALHDFKLKNTNRNDKCVCGSNLKAKMCCMLTKPAAYTRYNIEYPLDYQEVCDLIRRYVYRLSTLNKYTPFVKDCILKSIHNNGYFVAFEKINTNAIDPNKSVREEEYSVQCFDQWLEHIDAIIHTPNTMGINDALKHMNQYINLESL